MIPRKDIYGSLAILIVAILIGIYMHAYVSDRLARQHYDDVKQQVKENISALHDDLKSQIDAIKADHDARKTPQQIAQGVPAYFPGVHPTVIVAGGGPQTQGSATTGTLPDAPQPGSLIIAPNEAKPFWDNVTLCAQNSAALGTCVKEKGELQKQIESADVTIKGGKWYVRVGRVLKPIACATVGGGLASLAGAKPSVVAGSAAGGGAFCAIF